MGDIDIHDYADKAYTDLKSGRLVARFGADRFRCPFCPGKEDCRYNELLQHAIGVGASNHAAEVKANHLALANHLKTDHADAAGSLPPRQAEALMNPPRPLQDQELFVWPWMGILANVPVEETQRGGAIIMQQLAGFKPIRFDAVHCPDGVYTGFAIVRFKKDWIGFKDALGFHNYHKSHHLGKTDWEANKCEKYMFAWLAKEEDYRADDPEMSRKTDTLIARLTSQISAKSKYLTELKCKCNQMDLALQRAMEDSDSLNQRYNEEMGKVQSTAREHSLNFFHETDQLRKQLDEKANNIKRRSKQLSEIVAQTDMERRKLENERTKNDGQDDSLDMARIEQEKANESVRILVEKYEKEKEVALIETLQLEKQLDEKHRLELEIQQLRGKLGVVKHMEGEGVDGKKRTEELNKDLQDRIDAAEDLEELNQAPTIKERMTNDEIKLELVGLQGSVDPRMGQVDEKPFVEACKPKYGAEADAKALELCSMWQDNLRDANWHPFKIQIIDEGDEKLVELKEELGKEVYKAVTTALVEMNNKENILKQCKAKRKDFLSQKTTHAFVLTEKTTSKLY
ncbi:hypothetical protein VPH35_125775 [Triticum aestivum]